MPPERERTEEQIEPEAVECRSITRVPFVAFLKVPFPFKLFALSWHCPHRSLRMLLPNSLFCNLKISC